MGKHVEREKDLLDRFGASRNGNMMAWVSDGWKGEGRINKEKI